MAASAIPPTRPGLIGAGLTVEKPPGVDAEQAAVFLAPAADSSIDAPRTLTHNRVFTCGVRRLR